MSPFLISAVAFAVLGALLVLAGIGALLRLRPLGFTIRALAGLLVLALGALAGGVGVGMQGYQALTKEEVAARLVVRPTGTQSFVATIRFADNREATFDIAGDEIYIDAHILKWKALANLFGLHTAYELGRVAGRYRDIAQETTARRTVYALTADNPVDLFALRRRHGFLGSLFDAEYGSATFVPVTRPAELEVRVSTTGLLMRDAKPAVR